MLSSFWGFPGREMLNSEAASTMLLLNGWRFLIAAGRHLTKKLRIEAQRCFRLAGITVGLELAAELEAIGRQFDKEADDLSARKQAIAYHMCYRGFDRQQQATYRLPQPW